MGDQQGKRKVVRMVFTCDNDSEIMLHVVLYKDKAQLRQLSTPRFDVACLECDK